MSDVWLSIAPISFASTVMDTDDLSSIRGASAALLEFPAQLPPALSHALGLAVAIVATGGSEGYYRIANAPALPDLTAQLIRFFRFADDGRRAVRATVQPDTLAETVIHLKFTFGIAAVETYPTLSAALPRLRHDMAFRQYQEFELDVPDEAVASSSKDADLLPCSKDRTRPRTDTVYRSIPGAKPVKDVPVSSAIAARHSYGLGARRAGFYRAHANPPPATGFPDFSDSFEEIVTQDQPGQQRENGEDRMAIISLDGNRFGALRETFEAADPDNGTCNYMLSLAASRRALLGQLITRLSRLPVFRRGDPVMFRFETLLWGADEGLFVIPARGVPAFLATFHDALSTEGGTLRIPSATGEAEQELRLSYGIGVLICHYKTPIRMARRFADLLRDDAKQYWARRNREQVTTESYWQMMILNGMEVPMSGVADERMRRYGTSGSAGSPLFTIPLSQAATLFDSFSELKGNPGSRETGVARAKLAEIATTAIASRTQPGADGILDTEPFMERFQSLVTSSRRTADANFPEDYLATRFPWTTHDPLDVILPLLESWRFLETDGAPVS